MTGRETTILTRDHDLMDQFYKLIFLIDTHDQSMLFANKYVASPQLDLNGSAPDRCSANRVFTRAWGLDVHIREAIMPAARVCVG
jgi:hypothetical protein